MCAGPRARYRNVNLITVPLLDMQLPASHSSREIPKETRAELTAPALLSPAGVAVWSILALALFLGVSSATVAKAQGVYDPYKSAENAGRSQQSLVPESQRQQQRRRRAAQYRQQRSGQNYSGQAYRQNSYDQRGYESSGGGSIPRGYQQAQQQGRRYAQEGGVSQQGGQQGYTAQGYAPQGYAPQGYRPQGHATAGQQTAGNTGMPRGAMRGQSVSGSAGPRGNFIPGLGGLTSAAAVVAQTANQAWQFGDQLVKFKEQAQTSWDSFQELKEAAEGLDELKLRDIDGIFNAIDDILDEGRSLGYSMAGNAEIMEQEYSEKFPVFAEGKISSEIYQRMEELESAGNAVDGANDFWDDAGEGAVEAGINTFEAFKGVGDESTKDVIQGNFNVLQNLREHGSQIRAAREDLRAFQEQATHADTRQKAAELNTALGQYQIQEQQLQRQVLVAMTQQNSKWQNYKVSMSRQIEVANKMAFAQAVGKTPELSTDTDYQAANPRRTGSIGVEDQTIQEGDYRDERPGSDGWEDEDGDGLPDGWDNIYDRLPDDEGEDGSSDGDNNSGGDDNSGGGDNSGGEDDSGGDNDSGDDRRDDDCPRTNYYGECITDDGQGYMRSGTVGSNAWAGDH